MTTYVVSYVDKEEKSDRSLVMSDVVKERRRQTDKWGEQHHPDGTGFDVYQREADEYKSLNDDIERIGSDAQWAFILLEEVYEALSESNREKLREELVQVAAVAVAWIEDLDSRS